MSQHDTLQKIAALLNGYIRRWGFCGGWSIDLFLGRITRPHKDVDIAILRQDQQALYHHLSQRGWTLEKVVQHKLLPWGADEYIEPPLHEIWCRNPQYQPDFLEVLLNESEGAQFLFRRDRSIQMPLDDAFLTIPSSLPILAPEVALLYKSNDSARPENLADFLHSLPTLPEQRRAWLTEALERIAPTHAWLQYLRGA
jgi:Aminoglycoside-2''-adenylyltransferase